MKKSVLTAAAVMLALPVTADILVEFDEGAPKDRFTVTGLGECMTGPADVTIDRATGAYHLEETRRGVMAILDDLHKGRDSGDGWSLVIDVAAIVTSLSPLTGLWLLL